MVAIIIITTLSLALRLHVIYYCRLLSYADISHAVILVASLVSSRRRPWSPTYHGYRLPHFTPLLFTFSLSSVVAFFIVSCRISIIIGLLTFFTPLIYVIVTSFPSSTSSSLPTTRITRRHHYCRHFSVAHASHEFSYAVIQYAYLFNHLTRLLCYMTCKSPCRRRVICLLYFIV